MNANLLAEIQARLNRLERQNRILFVLLCACSSTLINATNRGCYSLGTSVPKRSLFSTAITIDIGGIIDVRAFEVTRLDPFEELPTSSGFRSLVPQAWQRFFAFGDRYLRFDATADNRPSSHLGYRSSL